MPQLFDTNDKVLCFDQSYFYEGRCVYARTIDDETETETENETEYFIYYTGRNLYEWVPESRVRRFDDENLMSVQALLCPSLKMNLETKPKKEYYISCNANTPVNLDCVYNKDYDYTVTDKHVANSTALKIIDAAIVKNEANDNEKTENKLARIRFEDDFDDDWSSDWLYENKHEIESQSSDSSDDSLDQQKDYKTDTKLCFDGRMFYEVVCVNQIKASDGINYYIHYVGWDDKWDEWVNESRILESTYENIKSHISLIGFKSLSDSFKSRFPAINESQETKEEIPIKFQFSVGEKMLCFDGKLFFEGICRNTVVMDRKPMYLIHYCGFGKALDEWVYENRLLKRTEKNIHSHRSLIAHVMEGGCDYEKSLFKFSNLKLI